MFKAILLVLTLSVPVALADTAPTNPKKETANTVAQTEPVYTQMIKTNSKGGKTWNIQLSGTIESPGKYAPLLLAMDMADKNDVFVFHLQGEGGDAMTMLKFYNAAKSTRADTWAVVEGPVYSAHAYLAVSMKHLRIKDGALFMFHRASTYGQSVGCIKFSGQTDRTQDFYKKCMDMYRTYEEMENNLVPKMLNKYLTQDEIVRVLNGEDVYVQGTVLNQRIGNN